MIGKLQCSNIWNHGQEVKNLNQEYVMLDRNIKNIDHIVQNLEELIDFLEILLQDGFDQEIFFDIQENFHKLNDRVSCLECQQWFSGECDNLNCYVDIQSGSGGIDAQDWVSMLLRMYLRWMEYKGFCSEVISESVGDIAGLKSVTVNVIGQYAYGWLRTETGIHRLVRKSPFHSGTRRHTSFASVFVYPESVNEIDIKINMSDLRFDVYRASGAGGQHVNRTESAVRITHLPTNIVTQCQSDRSQHKNKDQAMKQLKAKLYNLELEKKKIEKDVLEKSKLNITWGSQIRSYILDASRVKDLRTGCETCDVRSVLNGHLDQFIEASLKFGL